MKKVLRILGSWPFMIVVAALLIFGGYEVGVKRRARVCIRESYYGWVRVEYGVKDAPGLSMNWLFRGLEGYFPESGVLRTSAKPHKDFTDLDVYYGTAMEVRPVPDNMIHSRISSRVLTRPDGSHFDDEFEIMFIGPEQDYEQHRNELDRYKNGASEFVIPSLEALPKPGNVKQ